MKVRVVAAAIRTPDGVVHFLPAPARHHHVLQAASTSRDWVEEQGFVTNDGCFVDREAAMVIARKAGQLIRDESDPRRYQGPLLFSEDLW